MRNIAVVSDTSKAPEHEKGNHLRVYIHIYIYMYVHVQIYVQIHVKNIHMYTYDVCAHRQTRLGRSPWLAVVAAGAPAQDGARHCSRRHGGGDGD